MKETELEKREVEVGGVEEINAFSIQASAKAFKILISSLYSRKGEAVIRELWSNALDSHMRAGKAEVPFKCVLPTNFEPEFRLRDFGVSLTHERVMGFYTTLFASDKGDTNDQVGKFGLGAKVPFAYTDAFTVTAWLDGEKRIYNAFIDAKHIPQIALFSREESDEPEGLEIAFPVKAEDVREFHQAAKRCALGFAVPPDCNVDLPKISPVMTGAGWAIYGSDANISSLQIRQGCVLYPLDPKVFIKETVSGKVISADIASLACQRMIIDMPIGSVDIVPSREALHYDKSTIANLIKRGKEVVKELSATSQSKVDKAKSPWEAAVIMKKVTDSIGSNSLGFAVAKALRYKGRHIKSNFNVGRDRLARLAELGVKLFDLESYTSFETKLWRAETTTYIQQRCDNHTNLDPIDLLRNRRIIWGASVPGRSILSPKVEKFLADNSASHYRHHSIYFLQTPSLDHHALKRLWVMLGRCGIDTADKTRFIHIDEIDAQPISIKKLLPQVRRWRGDSFQKTGKDDAIGEEEKVFYVLTNGTNVESSGHNGMSQVDFSALLNELKRAKIIPFEINLVGIPRGAKAIRASMPEGWVNFVDHVQPLLVEAGRKYKPDIDRLFTYRGRHEYRRLASWITAINPEDLKDDSSPLKALRLAMNGFVGVDNWDPVTTLNLFRNLADVDDTKWDMSVQAGRAKLDQLTDQMGTEIVARYPFLKTLSDAIHYHEDDDDMDRFHRKQIADYINLIDERDALARANEACCDFA